MADFHFVGIPVHAVGVSRRGMPIVSCIPAQGAAVRDFWYTTKSSGPMLSKEHIGRLISVKGWTSDYNGKTYSWVGSIDLVPISPANVPEQSTPAVVPISPANVPGQLTPAKAAPVSGLRTEDLSLAAVLFDKAVEVALSECDGRPDQVGFMARVEAWAEKLAPSLVRIVGLVK